jgi:hypothetical protein
MDGWMVARGQRLYPRSVEREVLLPPRGGKHREGTASLHAAGVYLTGTGHIYQPECPSLLPQVTLGYSVLMLCISRRSAESPVYLEVRGATALWRALTCYVGPSLGL